METAADMMGRMCLPGHVRAYAQRSDLAGASSVLHPNVLAPPSTASMFSPRFCYVHLTLPSNYTPSAPSVPIGPFFCHALRILSTLHIEADPPVLFAARPQHCHRWQREQRVPHRRLHWHALGRGPRLHQRPDLPGALLRRLRYRQQPRGYCQHAVHRRNHELGLGLSRDTSSEVPLHDTHGRFGFNGNVYGITYCISCTVRKLSTGSLSSLHC